jgi:hypothetical protein
VAVTDGFYMACCTSVIVREVGMKEFHQRDIATSYALAMKSERAGADKPDWKAINMAILGRWKRSGLERIKQRAHDILNGKVTP